MVDTPEHYHVPTKRYFERWYKFVDENVRAYYDVSFEGLDNLKGLDTFVAMPKHQFYFDIPIDASAIYETTGKLPHYLMKRELLDIPVLGPLLYRLVGIPVPRWRDMKKILKEEGRDAFIKEKTVFENEVNAAYDAFMRHLNEGDAGVIYPEIHRHYNKVGKPNEPLLKHISGLRLDNGEQIPIVPIDRWIESKHPGSQIITTIGPPIREYDAKSLTDHLVSNINLMEK